MTFQRLFLWMVFSVPCTGPVKVNPRRIKLPPRDGWRSAVPAMDNENPPARISRDAPIQKSNFISYHMHSSWQQEVFAAVERSAKYFRKYLGSLVEVVNPGAEDFIVVSRLSLFPKGPRSRGQEGEKGRKVGLVKIKTIRPFPTEEIYGAL
ncbi:MAG: hypothetical protein Ct9H300mP23_06780 [Nitrospinota bacterium]|nr:MAG: hypothetical protein Ct9H300mP23_06780 [Nitrospinota bacterium]